MSFSSGKSMTPVSRRASSKAQVDLGCSIPVELEGRDLGSKLGMKLQQLDHGQKSGINGDSIVFNGVLMGFNGIINGDSIVFNGI